MRVAALVCGLALLVLLWMVPVRSQRALSPMPPGARAGDILPIPDIPSPRRAGPAELKEDADQLADLAAAVRLEIDQVNRGVLPKDLNPNLKRIEKLTKQLRAGIEP